MALKKSQLYSSIWQACDALRGGMDASQYKDYVLSLLFVRYVTDRYGKQANSEVVIPEGGSFNDLSLGSSMFELTLFANFTICSTNSILLPGINFT